MNSRKVCVYGASDDLVEIEDASGELTEEYSSYDKPFQAILSESATAYKASLRVSYESAGVWAVALFQVDEDTPFPNHWLPRLEHDPTLCLHSTVLVLELPAGVTLEIIA